jgi:predicted NUDIX family phosphoesterase
LVKLDTKFEKLGKKLIVEYDGQKVVLPKELQAKIDAYWDGLMRSGSRMTRGEGFHIVSIVENKNEIRVILSLSDYAHYIYSRRVGAPLEHAFKNIHTSCIIETSDGVLVFGVMGEETADPGNVQCVGGGLDADDLKGDRFDLWKNIKKEMSEEVGIDVADKRVVDSFELKYINYSRNLNSIAALFVLKLKIDSKEFKKRYEKFEKVIRKSGELPEFGELLYVKKNKKEVERFIKSNRTRSDHYIKPVLREIAE